MTSRNPFLVADGVVTPPWLAGRLAPLLERALRSVASVDGVRLAEVDTLWLDAMKAAARVDRIGGDGVALSTPVERSRAIVADMSGTISVAEYRTRRAAQGAPCSRQAVNKRCLKGTLAATQLANGHWRIWPEEDQ